MPEVVPPDSSSIVVHERSPDECSIYVEQPDGTEVRIAGDEPSAALADYSVSTKYSGGHWTADAELLAPRDIASFVARHAGITFRLPDREIVWEGRLEAVPDPADSGTLSISAMGHNALLEDVSLSFLGVDSSLDSWEEAPRARRREASDNGTSVNGAFQVSVDEGGMTITMDPDRNVKTTSMGELWYLGFDGRRISEIQYVGSDVNGSGMDTTVRAYDDLDGTATDTDTFDVSLTVASWVPSDPCKYLAFRDSPTGGDANKPNRLVEVHAVAVFGNHGLTRQNIPGNPDGLLFSDVLAYLVERHQPYLTLGTFDPSTIALPDVKWLEMTSLSEIIEEKAVLEYDRRWAVWGKTLEYRRRQDVGRTWQLRRSDGARFVRTGESSEPDVNCVLMSFTDRNGKQKYAGPPDSGADIEDASLRDTDPDNPVNASRVVGDRPLRIDGGDLTPDKAVELAAQALSEALKPRWTGEVEVPRFAMCDGVLLPSLLMRADDWIQDADSIDSEVMPLSATTYTRSRGDRPMTGTIDLPANRLDTALARIAIKPGKGTRGGRKRYRGGSPPRRRNRQKGRSR